MCYFCKMSMAPTIEETIAAGWIPSFFDGKKEVCEPVCQKCITKHLDYSDGEYRRTFASFIGQITVKVAK